jgi:radical SAM superfamily enzyme YgiQ (UPF0313 family)
MKCTLIIPSWQPEDIFPTKTAVSQMNYWQPLGTLYVASSMLKEGHDVRFLNGAFMSHADILKEVIQYNPDFIGIYSTTFGWKKAKETASDIKSVLKDTFIAVGGPYPIAMRGKCLMEADCIDAVVTGEGEITVIELLERLSLGKSLKDLEGVAFRENGKIVENPEKHFIEDLNSLLFPARRLLGDVNKYIPPPATYRRKPVAVMLTSRGCNRRCIYCFQIDRYRKTGIRHRSIDNVLAEIELCLKEGYREIKFIDDTFAADYDRAMELTQELIKGAEV